MRHLAPFQISPIGHAPFVVKAFDTDSAARAVSRRWAGRHGSARPTGPAGEFVALTHPGGRPIGPPFRVTTTRA